MRRVIGFACLALFLLAAAPARAELKIGYVDVQAAVLATKDGKAAKDKLEKMASSKQVELEKKLKDFKAMEEQLGKQIALMSDDQKKQKLQEYQQKGMELQQQYMEQQKAMGEEQEKSLAPIIQKLRAIITEIGLSEGYTIILEKSADSVLYAMPQLDLTAAVVKKYQESK